MSEHREDDRHSDDRHGDDRHGDDGHGDDGHGDDGHGDDGHSDDRQNVDDGQDDDDRQNDDDLTADVDGPLPGQELVNGAWLGTAAFAVTAIAAAAAPDQLRIPALVVAIVLFALGCVCFLWGFAVAVGRSRTDEIGIGGLFFLAGSAPPRARRPLLTALAIQIVVAFATAAVRPFTSLAFGILAPVFGLGVTGLWGARHGRFRRRPTKAQRAR